VLSPKNHLRTSIINLGGTEPCALSPGAGK
jgi:hypothetical protein